jgi:hypothetical protein
MAQSNEAVVVEVRGIDRLHFAVGFVVLTLGSLCSAILVRFLCL